MATVQRPVPEPTRASTTPRPSKSSKVVSWAHSTDPKVIGKLYLATAFGYFVAGGLMALLIRGELAQPGLQFLST